MKDVGIEFKKCGAAAALMSVVKPLLTTGRFSYGARFTRRSSTAKRGSERSGS